MKMVLVALIFSPCFSDVAHKDHLNLTIAMRCPRTVQMIWEERPEGPLEYARQMHYWSLPRDDRPPVVVDQEEPVVAKQGEPVVAKVTGNPFKKKKRKKRKRK